MRLDTAALTEAVAAAIGAEPDPSGEGDLISDRGVVVVAGDPSEFKAAFKRLKKVKGYRWIAINREDLFAANTLSIGSKAGIMDATGASLKAADLPRKKV